MDDTLALSFFKNYKNGSLIANGEIIRWDDGSTFVNALQESDGKVYNFNLFTNMDMCNTYRKIINEDNEKNDNSAKK